MGKQSMNRSGDAYLCARLNQARRSSRARKELIPSRSHGRGNSWTLHRISSLPAVLSASGLRDSDKITATKENLRAFSCLSRRTRFMSAGPGPRTRLCCLSGNLRGRSLFLSFSFPAFHRLFSSVALRLVPMRLLFPLVFTVSLSHGDLCSRKIAAPWAPLLPDRSWITRSKSVCNATFSWATLFRLFWSRRVFAIFKFAHANLTKLNIFNLKMN